MKNLLIVIGNLRIGGGQVVVQKLIENLDLSRYNTHVICCTKKANTLIEKRIEAICQVEYLNNSTGVTLSSLLYALKRISAYKQDIIHAHLGGVNYAIVWALLHHRRIVITAHTKPEMAFTKNIEKLLRIGIKKELVYLVAVSNQNAKLCKEYFHLNNERCFCINNGVDVGKHSRIQHEMFTFINVATQNENKNQRMIIECFEKLLNQKKETKLVLVGDGPEHERLKELVKEKGIGSSVVFTGAIDDPTYYYLISDIYIQSSHREAMPMSVLEAMGFGLPIISTNVGGLKDVVIDNGILVDDGDQEAMYEAMSNVSLMSDEDLNLMGSHSKIIASEYSAESMANRYMDVFDHIIGSDQV